MADGDRAEGDNDDLDIEAPDGNKSDVDNEY